MKIVIIYLVTEKQIQDQYAVSGAMVLSFRLLR